MMENGTIVTNKYKYTVKDYVCKGIYYLFSPVVASVASVFNKSPIEARFYLSLGILSVAYGYSNKTLSLLAKQAVLESGSFNSPMSVDDANLFGMHMPSVRPTTAKSSRWNFTEDSFVAQYLTEFDSVLDRILWDKYNNIKGDEADYVDIVLSKGYNSFDTYADAWRNTTFSVPLTIWIALGSVCVALVYLITKKR